MEQPGHGIFVERRRRLFEELKEQQPVPSSNSPTERAGASLTGSFANVASGGTITTVEGHTFRVDYGALSPSGDNQVVLSNFQAVRRAGNARHDVSSRACRRRFCGTSSL